ncbi:CatB-related O-acetyltransferase [Pseudomonas sp. P5_152]|uniref:CatB-related O-acetyltransferase n=1 Tax=Pseudomonas sp. P5_152 TaxID=3043442 RepID=UPI002A360857|nr:CatB-related O-acetyltransferase [Pseudomonas sp. P5_152]MDX9664250.1 CatB-related O-acetyltransferase [Pseudomonas sp. P5_152]
MIFEKDGRSDGEWSELLLGKGIQYENSFIRKGQKLQGALPVSIIDTKILNSSSVGRYSVVRGGRISAIIGDYCSIAPDVMMGEGNHPTPWLGTSGIFYQKNKYGFFSESRNFPTQPWSDNKNSPVIRHDVWIGAGVKIMRGVTIGIGAVVAANSIVTKDVPPYAIVGGAPAKIIKYRFDSELIEALIKSRWWVFDLSVIKKIDFTDPVKALQQLSEMVHKPIAIRNKFVLSNVALELFD